MTSAPPRGTAQPGTGDPETDARLARLHLRLGQLELARAELEALAGMGDLDAETLLALAEARWRTGDLPGAGEAAQACLDAGRDDTLALVIAAEATAAIGRPGEARRIAGQALERGEPLDPVFAGIPRSLIWPVDPADVGEPAGVLFPEPDPRAARVAVGPREASERAEAGTATVSQRDQGEPPTPGLWDMTGAPRVAGGELPDARSSLAAATAALADGRFGDGAVHLAIALRLASALAPAVLELVEASERRTPELELVRGDAYRVVGHESEARRAYATAATGVVRDRRGWRSEDRT